MASLKMIFGVGRGNGWRDDDIRALAKTLFDTHSLRALTRDQCARLVAEMRRRGGAAGGNVKTSLSGPYAAKIQALWIAAYNLGLVRERSDAAIISFVRRQTGLENANWLIEAKAAAKVIEAIKGMLVRAGCDLAPIAGAPAHLNDPRYRVVAAQCWRLRDMGLIDACMASPSIQATEICGKELNAFTKADWQNLQNALGQKIRDAL